MEFYKKYFVDHQYGEVYQTTNRTGSPTTTQKASYWKAGYHSIELGYYIYLYTNLYLYKNPVHLYYKIDASDTAKALMLYPLAIEDSCLKITNVTLNGEEYTDFLSDKRVLNIPQNIGGIFKVTFENIVPVDVEHTLQANITGFELKQNFPNPFNPSTMINYSLPAGRQELPMNSFVNLKVYDILGREVATLVNEEKPAGNYEVKFDASNISSGVYLYKLQAGEYNKTMKMILIK
ncbi:MAG: T9SS type A sorting domain-containing protein [Ignavibacteria bacterium]|nr:T9SS type A sorting domain-containing protein [Ignavibacteria bacterium]